MSFARSKVEPDIKIARPVSRVAKLALIREIFAAQGTSGWDAKEQNQYLESIGLRATEKNKARADDELDLIIADMERHRMILFK